MKNDTAAVRWPDDESMVGTLLTTVEGDTHTVNLTPEMAWLLYDQLGCHIRLYYQRKDNGF